MLPRYRLYALVSGLRADIYLNPSSGRYTLVENAFPAMSTGTFQDRLRLLVSAWEDLQVELETCNQGKQSFDQEQLDDVTWEFIGLHDKFTSIDPSR